MRFGFLLVIALTVTVVPAEAAFKGCYERVYDKRYLRKNRKQDIVKLRLQIGVGGDKDAPPEFYDRIDATLRKTIRYEGNLVTCEPLGDELNCSIEGDRGGFIVTDRGKNSIRITSEGFMNFGDDKKPLSVQAKGQNVEFRLFRISEGPCP
jgi:hypothetical protein